MRAPWEVVWSQGARLPGQLPLTRARRAPLPLAQARSPPLGLVLRAGAENLYSGCVRYRTAMVSESACHQIGPASDMLQKAHLELRLPHPSQYRSCVSNSGEGVGESQSWSPKMRDTALGM